MMEATCLLWIFSTVKIDAFSYFIIIIMIIISALVGPPDFELSV